MQDTYTEACSICVGTVSGNTIVEVAGEVDIATVSLLAKAVSDAVKSGKGNVILDAQQLAYVDSAGLQTLLSAQHQLSTKGRKMAIVGCHGIFHKLIRMSKLDSHFRLYTSVDEAIESLK